MIPVRLFLLGWVLPGSIYESSCPVYRANTEVSHNDHLKAKGDLLVEELGAKGRG